MDKSFLINLILFIIIFVLELFFSEYIISKSSKLTIKLQKWDIRFKYYFWTFEIFFFNLIFLNTYTSIYFFRNKIKGLMFIGFGLINIFISNYIKTFYHKSRPIFYNNKIKLYFDCKCSYGFLSGHCFESTFFYYLFYKLYIPKNTNNFLRILILIILSFIVVNIGLSRLYLGNHSINQVLAGYALGINFIFIYHKYKLKIKNFIKEIIYFKNKNLLLTFNIILIFLFMINLILIYINYNFKDYKKINKSKVCNYCFKNKWKFDTSSIKIITTIFALIGLLTGYYLFPNQQKIKHNKILYFLLIFLNYVLLYSVFRIQFINIFFDVIFKIVIYFSWGFNTSYTIDKISQIK